MTVIRTKNWIEVSEDDWTWCSNTEPRVEIRNIKCRIQKLRKEIAKNNQEVKDLKNKYYSRYKKDKCSLFEENNKIENWIKEYEEEITFLEKMSEIIDRDSNSN